MNEYNVNSVTSEVRNTLAKHKLYLDPYSILELVTVLKSMPCDVSGNASLTEFLNLKLGNVSTELTLKEVSIELTEIKRRICGQGGAPR